MDWIERLPPTTKWFFIVGGSFMSFFSGALPESIQTAGLLCGLLLIGLGLWQARREAFDALRDACAQFPWRIRIEHRDHPPPLGAAQVATATVSDVPQRKLSEAQKEILSDEMKERGVHEGPGQVELRYLAGCTECKTYAGQIADALINTGWIGEPKTTIDERHEPEVRGVLLCVADIDAKPRNANVLATAFRAAKVEFGWWPWPGLDNQTTLIFVYPIKQA